MPAQRHSRGGRPIGEIAVAMLAAAGEAGTLREIGERAQVGRAAALYTGCRLIERGQLVRLSPPGRKPALVQSRAALKRDATAGPYSPADLQALLAAALRRR